MNTGASTRSGGPGERTITVIQGEVHISRDPQDVLSTILGSCVAVCMWDPDAKIGGMNHFLLPEASGRQGDTIKYGAHAMELLINGLLREGAARAKLVCKLFGGASMGNHSGKIGQGNIAFARSFIADEGIPCVSESLGGNEARRIRFWPTTGNVKLLIVPRVEVDVERPPVRERPAAKADEITLF